MVIWDVLIAIFIWRAFFHTSEKPDYDEIREIVREEIKRKKKHGRK
ncbi:hypothetical protein LCGC14_0441950 [marine sediment metagenome]|uniref:Uncharacterized protein n=1 Tax=marine sediment metagenome TaxID=412755 RepID=A0A0F9V755_9ZZZZ